MRNLLSYFCIQIFNRDYISYILHCNLWVRNSSTCTMSVVFIDIILHVYWLQLCNFLEIYFCLCRIIYMYRVTFFFKYMYMKLKFCCIIKTAKTYTCKDNKHISSTLKFTFEYQRFSKVWMNINIKYMNMNFCCSKRMESYTLSPISSLILRISNNSTSFPLSSIFSSSSGLTYSAHHSLDTGWGPTSSSDSPVYTISSH